MAWKYGHVVAAVLLRAQICHQLLPPQIGYTGTFHSAPGWDQLVFCNDSQNTSSVCMYTLCRGGKTADCMQRGNVVSHPHHRVKRYSDRPSWGSSFTVVPKGIDKAGYSSLQAHFRQTLSLYEKSIELRLAVAQSSGISSLLPQGMEMIACTHCTVHIQSVPVHLRIIAKPPGSLPNTSSSSN